MASLFALALPRTLQFFFWLFSRKIINFIGIRGSVNTDAIFLVTTKVPIMKHLGLVFLISFNMSLFLAISISSSQSIYSIFSNMIYVTSGLAYLLTVTISVLYVSNLRIFIKEKMTMMRLGHALISFAAISSTVYVLSWVWDSRDELSNLSTEILFVMICLTITLFLVSLFSSWLAKKTFIIFLMNNKNIRYRSFTDNRLE